MTLTELIDVFKDTPREFEPGDRWKYSNSGYVLLGVIIEKASGLTYEGFLRKNIFDPLGLKHTFYGRVSPVIPGRVPGYETGFDGAYLNAGYISMTQPYAAGSLLSNVDDLAAWNQALLEGRLIKRETLERAWTAYKLKDGTSTGYGYGWSIGESFGTRIIFHDGDINGFSSAGILFPEERLIIVLLSNREASEFRPDRIASRIAALVLGKSFSEPKAVSIDPEIFDQYVGEYELAPGFTVRIFRDGTRFMSQGTGEPAFEIFPETETRFFLKVGEGKAEFVKDEAGKVIEMVLTVRGRTIRAKRILK
jgi:CubicO group peptidase (beta-lactamase class C family)